MSLSVLGVDESGQTWCKVIWVTESCENKDSDIFFWCSIFASHCWRLVVVARSLLSSGTERTFRKRECSFGGWLYIFITALITRGRNFSFDSFHDFPWRHVFLLNHNDWYSLNTLCINLASQFWHMEAVVQCCLISFQY